MSGVKSKTLLTEGVIWKKIVGFAIPLFLGNLFQQLENTAATGSSTGSLIFLLVGFFNGIAVGAGVVIARYFGARRQQELQDAIHTTVGFGIVSGILLTVIGLIMAPKILIWMKTPADVLVNSVLYFRIYFLGSLAFVLYNNFVGILQAVGDSRHPLYYLIVSSVLTILLGFCSTVSQKRVRKNTGYIFEKSGFTGKCSVRSSATVCRQESRTL